MYSRLMFPKRPFQFDGGEDGASGSAQGSKRLRDVPGRISMDDYVARIMEPCIRRAARDAAEGAVERHLRPSSRPLHDETRKSGDSGYLLHFVNRFPSTIFTNSRIGAEDGSSIRIELLDAATKEVVRYGPLSSVKTEIVAIDSDFGSGDQEAWDERRFTSRIIREREGRRPLVTGAIYVTLKDGAGEIGNVCFTDNSRWQRSQKFRLGARVLLVQNNPEVRIREAVSEAFRVKDDRGELSKKHYPPRLVDEVWRLEKIAKNGAFRKRLAANRIHNVKEFLQLYAIDSSRLQQMIKCGNSKWDAIIKHASTCVPDDGKLYSFYDARQGVRLLFDSVYRLVHAALDGQNYKRLDDLTPPQRVLVENSKRQAYKNADEFLLVDEHALFGPSRSLTTPPAEPFHGPSVGLQQLEFPAPHQGQLEMQPDFGNASCSMSFAYALESGGPFEFSLAQHSRPMPTLPHTMRNSFEWENGVFPPHTGENNWSASSSQLPASTGAQFLAEDISQLQTSTWPLVNSMLTPGIASTFASDGGGDIDIISSQPRPQVLPSRIGKSKARWRKIRAAFKWLSVIREVAAKRLYPIF